MQLKVAMELNREVSKEKTQIAKKKVQVFTILGHQRNAKKKHAEISFCPSQRG